MKKFFKNYKQKKKNGIKIFKLNIFNNKNKEGANKVKFNIFKKWKNKDNKKRIFNIFKRPNKNDISNKPKWYILKVRKFKISKKPSTNILHNRANSIAKISKISIFKEGKNKFFKRDDFVREWHKSIKENRKLSVANRSNKVRVRSFFIGSRKRNTISLTLFFFTILVLFVILFCAIHFLRQIEPAYSRAVNTAENNAVTQAKDKKYTTVGNIKIGFDEYNNQETATCTIHPGLVDKTNTDKINAKRPNSSVFYVFIQGTIEESDTIKVNTTSNQFYILKLPPLPSKELELSYKIKKNNNNHYDVTFTGDVHPWKINSSIDDTFIGGYKVCKTAIKSYYDKVISENYYGLDGDSNKVKVDFSKIEVANLINMTGASAETNEISTEPLNIYVYFSFLLNLTSEFTYDNQNFDLVAKKQPSNPEPQYLVVKLSHNESDKHNTATVIHPYQFSIYPLASGTGINKQTLYNCVAKNTDYFDQKFFPDSYLPSNYNLSYFNDFKFPNDGTVTKCCKYSNISGQVGYKGGNKENISATVLKDNYAASNIFKDEKRTVNYGKSEGETFAFDVDLFGGIDISPITYQTTYKKKDGSERVYNQKFDELYIAHINITNIDNIKVNHSYTMFFITGLDDTDLIAKYILSDSTNTKLKDNNVFFSFLPIYYQPDYEFSGNNSFLLTTAA